MKIIFAGTPEFALPALKKLLNSDHEICAVYTKPDKPSGRGQKVSPSPIKTFALESNLPIYQPESLKNPESQKEMQELNADLLVNVAYGMLLPKQILNIPKFGCINIHPSLLPLWRGAAPIQRSILAGDTITGVTIMEMDVGLDTGDIYKQTELPIDTKDTSTTLFNKAATLGSEMLLEVINKIENKTAITIKQDNSKSTYANKISKDEAKIDWSKSAKEIDQMIRAFNPWPIAYMEFHNKNIRIWESDYISHSNSTTPPGTIINTNKNSIDVMTGSGLLRILKIQIPGSKILSSEQILNGHKDTFTIGKVLE